HQQHDYEVDQRGRHATIVAYPPQDRLASTTSRIESSTQATISSTHGTLRNNRETSTSPVEPITSPTEARLMPTASAISAPQNRASRTASSRRDSHRMPTRAITPITGTTNTAPCVA